MGNHGAYFLCSRRPRSALCSYEICLHRCRNRPVARKVVECNHATCYNWDHKGGIGMLGEQIKEKREQKRMTQEELAEKVGVSRQAISKWEQNLAKPAGSNLKILCEILTLDESSLVGVPKNGQSDGALDGNRPAKQPGAKGIKAVVTACIPWSGWAVAAVLAVILLLPHLRGLPAPGTGAVQKMIGYIQIAGDRLTLDEIEFITDEDMERIKELGLTENDMPNGYFIMNEDFELNSYRIGNTTYTYINWGETDPDKRIRSTRAAWEFMNYLSTYTDNGAGIPFWVEVMDGEVLSITEQYVP